VEARRPRKWERCPEARWRWAWGFFLFCEPWWAWALESGFAPGA
jgi:hypothetical protein